ncbi:transglutaminase domain-containing protein [Halobacterium jilantaiense]|uniref:Transglutaminase-like enzyme, putative cysteine protease n=1 Tax=Halobacterium jilantaiense TaxID=355548 RepID=A0A1I0MFE1_9EURY|nr:transglutaminase domain-containing protein [Halobacterium jilantaiense]SEV87095.1 Transglutaminase-like enzyme, putative cysteine protease [Halobacterium jilantaiense]
MSDAAPDGPDTRRALLAVAAAFALVAAAAAAPALAGEAPLGGLDSPASAEDLPRALSQFDFVRDLVGEPSDAGGLEVPGGETFGALTAGGSTDVGGPISEEQLRGAARPHFLATSEEPQYWRTTGYVAYTGGGWAQRPVSRVAPSRPPDQREVTWHTVTLRQPANRLPAPWRPVDLRYDPGPETDQETTFDATETSGIAADPLVPAGETYEVSSLESVSDRGLLREVRVSGSVASTEYTTVDTTQRVSRLAERIVGDADNRYDAAAAVEAYLEGEKTYSLRDAPETGDQAADEFLFEHDVGYCENFATAMTVLLRTQDVPARYVAGYTSGERVGDDQYLVRGADAHAWVEVFFEDYGWVRFDPTPSAPRQQADSDLAAGSETFQVRVSGALVPGESVAATVTAAGSPVSGAAVSVNGGFASVTNESGAVRFVVPYAESVNVTVEPSANRTTTGGAAGGYGLASLPGREQPDDGRNGSASREFEVQTDVSVAFDSPPQPGETLDARLTVGGRPFADAAVSLDGTDQGRTNGNGELTVTVPETAAGVVDIAVSRDDLSKTVSYPLDDLQVAVSPDLVAPLPTTGATAKVTSGGEPVVGAPVQLNGKQVGVTDADGAVRLTIPLDRAPSVTATASGKTATAAVDWVLVSLALAVLAAAGVLAGVALAARRRGLTLARVVAALRYAAREALAAAVDAISGLGDALDDLAAEFRAAAADGWREVLAWLTGLPARLRLPDLAGFVERVAAAARAGSRTAADGTADDDTPAPLQRVWARFVALVGVEGWRTKTPVEVAQAAVDAGFPREPVTRVASSFRDAAYGGRDTDAAAEEAADALGDLDAEEGEQ